MPCSTQKREAEEQAKRQAQIKSLEAALKAKSAKLVKHGNVVSLDGWTDRGEWCDECAIRALKLSSDMTIRKMATEITSTTTTLKFGHSHTHN